MKSPCLPAMSLIRPLTQRHKNGMATASDAFNVCGDPGMMDDANRGAFEAGCRSVGLNRSLRFGQHSNSYIMPELCC